MVTINDELLNFYNNMNGNISTLNSKANNLIEAIDDLKKHNNQFSDSIAYHYKGKVQKTTLQSLSNIDSTIGIITASINDKIYTSITKSQELLGKIEELMTLKKKIDYGVVVNTPEQTEKSTTVNQEQTGDMSSNNYVDVYAFNNKQTEALTILKELLDLDGLVNPGKEDIKGEVIETEDLLPGKYSEYKFTASNGITIDYWAYIPANIEDVDGVPIHIHLWPCRDKGPMGYYNVHGLPRILYQGGDANGVVICPKMQAKEVYDSDHIDAIKELSDSFVKTYNCDSSRISVSGQGGGGQAAINFAVKYPDYLSKVVSLYTIDVANNYDEVGVNKQKAESNLAKNDVTLIRCTGGGKTLDTRSISYTNQLYDSLKDTAGVDLIDNPHYIYGDDLFTETFTYNGKSYDNLLDYCFAQTRNDDTTSNA